MIKDLAAFKEHASLIHKCQKCHLFGTCEKKQVAIGNPKSHVLMVLEAPHTEEVKYSRALCFEEGVYLQKHLIRAGFEVNEIFVTYCVCCTLPELRVPTDEECGACFGHLWKTITMFQPKLILTVGQTPTKVLCKSKKSVTTLQGSVIPIGGYKVMPLQYPGFIMRKGTRIQVKEYGKAIQKARDLVFV